MTNTVPRFIATPKTWMVQATAANPNIDGTGTLVTLVTGAAAGSKIDTFTVRAAAEVKANNLRLFLVDGVTTHLWEEVLVSATSGAMDNAEVFNTELVPTQALILPPDWELKIGLHTADAVNIFAIGGDY